MRNALLSNSWSDSHGNRNTNRYAYRYGHSNCNASLDTYWNSDTDRYGDANSNPYAYTMSIRQTGCRVFYVCGFKHSHRCHCRRVRCPEWICH